MKSATGLIISREYLERVKRKSFIITTILMPILMLGLMVAPTLFLLFSEPESMTVAVIDDSGVVAPYLKNGSELTFVPATGGLEEERGKEGIDAILVIGRNAVDETDNIQFYSHSAPSLSTETEIMHQLEDGITDIRLKEYKIENLKKILEEVKADVHISTIRIDEEEDTETSSGLSYGLGMIMDMLLYMFILIYGQMVMTSIIEEKNNRVLEIVVSSVNPTSLMLGKIVGIGLVAITQILIWGVLLGCATGWLLPLVANSASVAEEPELAGMFGQLLSPGYLASLFVYMILFFIGGYLFYSSIFAAVGSSVDNIQDASQLSSIATMPVIIGIVASMSIIQNPNSALAFWVSVIPFTSPMAMMSRIPFGIPTWEIILSLVILYLSFMFMIWFAAKIYRVGIFMYGKKPNLADLLRWARYK